MTVPTVIFLDIDGVICCNLNVELEKKKMEKLQAITQATGAAIVLSSDWRREVALKQKVLNEFAAYGIEVIGSTPTYLAADEPVRPVEILEWLDKEGKKLGVEHWVTIDDRQLDKEKDGEHMIGRFIHTSSKSGLTQTHVEKAIKVLRNQQAALDGTYRRVRRSNSVSTIRRAASWAREGASNAAQSARVSTIHRAESIRRRAASVADGVALRLDSNWQTRLNRGSRSPSAVEVPCKSDIPSTGSSTLPKAASKQEFRCSLHGGGCMPAFKSEFVDTGTGLQAHEFDAALVEINRALGCCCPAISRAANKCEQLSAHYVQRNIRFSIEHSRQGPVLVIHTVARALQCSEDAQPSLRRSSSGGIRRSFTTLGRSLSKSMLL